MTEQEPNQPRFFLNYVLPIVGGLAVAGVLIYFRVENRRAREAEHQRRLEESYRLYKAQLRRDDPIAKAQDQAARLVGKDGPAAPGLALGKEFLRAVEAGNLAGAYEMTSDAFRKRFAAATFENLIRKHPLTTQPDRCTLLTTAKLSSGTIVTQSVRTGPSEGASVVEVTAVLQDRWLIDHLSLLPDEKAP